MGSHSNFRINGHFSSVAYFLGHPEIITGSTVILICIGFWQFQVNDTRKEV